VTHALETGARTSEQVDRSQAIAGIRNIYRRGGDPGPQINDAIHQGLISHRDVPHIRQQARMSDLQRDVQGLSLPEKLNAYDAATPQERQEIAHEVRKTVSSARQKPWEWTPQSSILAMKYFGIRPTHSSSDLAMPPPIGESAPPRSSGRLQSPPPVY
jgi:hypothetical protein